MSVIIFIDLDYFYAQVEEILNPDIKDKPVVVCVYSGRNEKSGAVATSNYIARSIGIKSGMPLSQALNIGKDKAIFLPIRKDLYKEYSDKVMKIISLYSDKIEIASIDEAYIDVSDKCKTFDDGIKLGYEIKNRIYNDLSLKVSIGISINKVIAKILGDMAKPNGLKYVGEENINDFLLTLKVNKIPGIGKILSKKLEDINVVYINDIKKYDKNTLLPVLGNSKYNYLYDIANNIYNKPVEERVKKNFGRYMTLMENTRDTEKIIPYLMKSIESSYEKAPGIPMEISVVAIMEDLDIISRSFTGKRIKKEDAIDISKNLLKKILDDDTRNIRRIGVRLSKITNTESLDDFF